MPHISEKKTITEFWFHISLIIDIIIILPGKPNCIE